MRALVILLLYSGSTLANKTHHNQTQHNQTRQDIQPIQPIQAKLANQTRSTQAQCTFPSDFKFGTATSAYQVEGAWNVSGKTESTWDYGTHKFPEKIANGANGDIACDAYNHIDVDIANLKMLNVAFYRFSISWTRLLPNGGDSFINPDGVRYYNEQIDKLLANKIEPMVTIFHWDLPQSLQNLGGWTNKLTIEYYLQFARTCFKLFGDRVKTWITMNEIYVYCAFIYENGVFPPFGKSAGIGTYLCGHNMLIAHGETYQLYKNEFFDQQKGEIGLAIDSPWFYPKTNSSEDKLAAQQALNTSLGWLAHPIFSTTGDYPSYMRQRIDENSKKQGFRTSRLPKFTESEIALLKGSADFFGLNHYISEMAAMPKNYSASDAPSFDNDRGVDISYNASWPSTARDFFKVVPESLRYMLVYIKNNFNNPKVYITENGYAGSESEFTDDEKRVNYTTSYLTEVLKAITVDKCNVKRYTFWSFLDNFEWFDGYKLRFGLFHVDFNSSQRTRTAKKSALAYKSIISSYRIPQCGGTAPAQGGSFLWGIFDWISIFG